MHLCFFLFASSTARSSSSFALRAGPLRYDVVPDETVTRLVPRKR